MEHKELLRFREKSHFVAANDPASLLAEFFIAVPNANFNDSLEQLPSAVLERSSQLTKTEVAKTLELTQTWRARLESIGCSL